jgi:mRNA interferase MazF
MKAGTVALVRFPFTRLEQAKKRPVLVMSAIQHSSKIHLGTVAMITSKLDGLDLNGDVRIKEWEKARLIHPSLVRLSKLATVDIELIEREMGALSDSDKREVAKAFQRLYRTWVAPAA